MPNPPKVPAGLDLAGKRLWREVCASVDADWVLGAKDLALLEHAARASDTVAALEEQVKRDGLMIPGSMDQERLHPAVSEVRQQKMAIAGFLKQIQTAAPLAKTGRLNRRQRNQLRDDRQRVGGVVALKVVDDR